MSRITCQSPWMATIKTGLCRHSRNATQGHCREIYTSSSLFTKSASSFATDGSARPKRTKLAPYLESQRIDTVSQNLIKDLYTNTSSKRSNVSVKDILALKPASTTVTPDEFNKLKELIGQSFNVSQLKEVLRSQKMPTSGKKAVLLNQTMLLMDLEIVVPVVEPAPIVEDPYSAAAEENFESEVFPSNRRELFFILGTEGDSLRQLEKEKHVRVSINIDDETYTIRGEKESIVEAKERIQDLVAVTEESWDISSYKDRATATSSPSVLEEIARRSETFVSVGDDSTLVIAGRSSSDMEEAKRLFDLKMQKPDSNAASLTFLHQEDELKPVGMFPVFDPVTMTAQEAQKSFFRFSQTEPFADKTCLNPTIYPVRSTKADIGTFAELKAYIENSAELAPAHSLDLTAHFGHLLYQNKDPKLNSAPLPHAMDTVDLEPWLEQAEAPFFFESLPFYKVVSRLPMIGDKERTIEAEYVRSSRMAPTSDGMDASTWGPVRVLFNILADDQIEMRNTTVLNKRLLTNLMMLGQPTDIQLRAELTTKIAAEDPTMTQLLSEITLPFHNRLQCPSFFTFRDSAIPSASQLGLAPTHTLRSILFRTSGRFNFHGLPLVASEVTDQFGHVHRQELKLLPTPLKSDTEEQSTEAATTSPLVHWDEFTQGALELNRII